MNNSTDQSNENLLRHLYHEVYHLKDQFNSILMRMRDNTLEGFTPDLAHLDHYSLQQNMAELSLTLLKILYNEKNPKTHQPLILDIISKDKKLFHPLRISNFKLIHTEVMSVRTEEKIYAQHRNTVFTIPLLYASPEISRLTKKDEETRERLSGSIGNSIENIHEIPLNAPIDDKELEDFFITDQAQDQEIPTSYEFIYECPFERESERLLNLREWLDQQAICVNDNIFTIEEILKEVRNKIAAHHDIKLKISKKSFLYNTKFMDYGHPYWAYFILFCAHYIIFIVGKKLNEKGKLNFKVGNVFDEKISVHSMRPHMFPYETFSYEKDDYFLIFSENVSFPANTTLNSNFYKINTFRVVFETASENKFYEIPMLIFKNMFTRKEKGESIELYLHLKKNICGFGSAFKNGADFVIYFIKNKNSGILDIEVISYSTFPITAINILATENTFGNNADKI